MKKMKRMMLAAFGTAVLCFALGVTADDPIPPLPNDYIITGSGGEFTAQKYNVIVGTPNQPLQSVINTIRADAAGAPCNIQFGYGITPLDIGDDYITFDGGSSGNDWGLITLTGKINSASSFTVISLSNNVSVNSRADITSTSSDGHGSFYGILSQMGAALTVSSGTVSSPAGIAVSHNSSGALTVSGGSISATTGTAVDITNSATLATISGGSISVTSGTAVQNAFRCAINISGGSISATTGVAINQNADGVITISGNALITSANTNSDRGTITLRNSVSTTTDDRLIIQGGTVENTANSANARAIYNASAGRVTISGGKVLARDGYAVYTALTAEGTVNLTGNGLLFAYGTNTEDVIYGDFTQSESYSMIIAWNQAAGNTIYTYSDNDDLFTKINPDMFLLGPLASTVWSLYAELVPGDDRVHGIAYAYGSNTGFIQIEGVTVMPGENQRTVTFVCGLDNSVFLQNMQIVLSGGKVTKPADPTLADYTFAGWFIKDNGVECGVFGLVCRPGVREWDFDTDAVTENITLYAEWISANSVLTSPLANSFMPPVVSVRGRTLNVKFPSGSQSSQTAALQIRMIDMRGRMVSKFNITGGIDNSYSLTKIPAGRYIVEVRNAGKRVSSMPVMIR